MDDLNSTSNTGVIVGYNTSYTCKYMDNATGDEDTDTDKYQDDMAGIFLLPAGQVHNKSEILFTTINDALEVVYENIGDNSQLRPLFEKAANSVIMMNDAHLGLLILYAYEYMYLFHPIISQLLVNVDTIIDPIKIEEIMTLIDINTSAAPLSV